MNAMALHHAASGEVVDLAPLRDRLQQAHTAALVKTDSFEAIRLVLRAGETLPAHTVSGQFTLFCLEGRIVLDLPDKSLSLDAHQWVFFDSGVTHGVRAIEPSSLLLTILLPD
ncbi:cupin [Tsuneonella deserti]|jgi:quercetin dioxygenase-like cupin family protein|uniref:Cupin n=2 Tax=Tsuneonella deserti TaxID=2035528 RepID=A0ABQ1SBI4_9SPHN|nr:cupin [Tsuneonella deserti]